MTSVVNGHEKKLFGLPFLQLSSAMFAFFLRDGGIHGDSDRYLAI